MEQIDTKKYIVDTFRKTTSFNSIANILGFQSKLFGFIFTHKKYYYRNFQIKKQDGKTNRIISFPDFTPKNLAKFVKDFDKDWDESIKLIDNGVELLRYSQLFIQEYILLQLKTHDYVYGFVNGKSPLDMAKKHENKKLVIALDIKNFFPSVHVNDIQRSLIKNYGFERMPAWVIGEITTYNKRLNQGNPTSPSASNIAFYDMDKQIKELSEIFNLNYTRYADDLVFSTDKVLSDNKIRDFIFLIKQNLKFNYYKLNEKKTKIMKSEDKQTVLGYIVNKKAGKSKFFTRTLRSAVHNFMNKNMIPQGENPERYRRHLLGLVNYVNYSYNGDSFSQMFEQLKHFDTKSVKTWFTANYKVKI
jgi:hypothetical protein